MSGILRASATKIVHTRGFTRIYYNVCVCVEVYIYTVLYTKRTKYVHT